MHIRYPKREISYLEDWYQDGLDKRWDEGVHQSDYLGELSLHDEEDVRHIQNVTTSNLISCINNPSEWRSFDVSRMGAGDDREDAKENNNEKEIEYERDNIINGEKFHVVCNLPFEFFRAKL
eukprot:7503006-Ditylum_brightwellii.AAC.1